MTRTLRAAGSLAVVVWLAAALLTPPTMAQTPQRPAPVFTGGTNLVTLDVSVLDRNHQPVRGLRANDFVLKEDGKPQTVSVLQEIDLDDPPPPPVAWMKDVAPDVTTNTIGESRLVIILVDDAMIPVEPRIIRDTRKILDDVIARLGPNDYAALAYPVNSDNAQGFTHDRAALRAAADKFTGGIVPWHDPVPAFGHFYLSVVRTLRGVTDLLIHAPQRRKALIWISPGVPMDPSQLAPQMALSGMANRDVQIDLYAATTDMLRQAQRANVAIYPIDPAGLGGMADYLIPGSVIADNPMARLMFDFLETTAANTGGHAIVNTNDFGPGIDEIFKENSSYYLLGLRPLYTKDDGTFHRVDVAVNRPGVEVRTRTGYYAGDAGDAKKKEATTSPENAILVKALHGVLPESGLPLGVTAAPFAVPGTHTAAVAVVLGVDQPVPDAAAGAKLTETTELQISAYTPDGAPRGGQRSTAHVALRQGARGEAVYDVFGRIDLAPGHYVLRIAAHNPASDKTGSVAADIVVPDFSNDAFSISGLVVSRTPGRASAPKDLFTAILPLEPTAERTFEKGDQAEAYFRVYQSGAKPLGDVQVAMRIANDHGGTEARDTRALAVEDFTLVRPASERQGVPTVSRFGPTPDRPDPFANPNLREAAIRYALPIGRLASGEYLLAIDATLRTTTFHKDVRFTVK